jgi:hypothetical protein
MILPDPMPPALYRVYQFFVALKAGLPVWAGGHPATRSPAATALVESILPTEAQRALFHRMPPNDQRHALAVARTLQQAGHTQPALMQAALLHDVAKSMGQPLIHRVLIVLLEAFWPAALVRLSRWPAPTSPIDPATLRTVSRWRRPFVIHAWHPEIGAIWATQAGCDALAVQLILHHPSPPLDFTPQHASLLKALQWADNQN